MVKLPWPLAARPLKVFDRDGQSTTPAPINRWWVHLALWCRRLSVGTPACRGDSSPSPALKIYCKCSLFCSCLFFFLAYISLRWIPPSFHETLITWLLTALDKQWVHKKKLKRSQLFSWKMSVKENKGEGGRKGGTERERRWRQRRAGRGERRKKEEMKETLITLSVLCHERLILTLQFFSFLSDQAGPIYMDFIEGKGLGNHLEEGVDHHFFHVSLWSWGSDILAAAHEGSLPIQLCVCITYSLNKTSAVTNATIF